MPLVKKWQLDELKENLDAQKIKGKEVDDSAIGDGKVLTFKSGSGKIEYETPAGGGDMLKSTYDPNDDGVVKDSDKLEGSTKAEVQDHDPKAHTHTESEITDLDHDADKIKGVAVNDSAKGEGKVLVYHETPDELQYEEPSGGGGSAIKDGDADTKVDTEESSDEDTVRMDTAGVECFNLDPNGILTLAKQPACKAWLSDAIQSIPTDTNTKIDLDSVSFDVQSEFSVANGRYVATKGGIYLCLGQSQWKKTVIADKRYVTSIYKNGAQVALSSNHSSNETALNSLCICAVQVEAGDYLELWVWHNAGVNVNAEGGTEFRTWLIVAKIA